MISLSLFLFLAFLLPVRASHRRLFLLASFFQGERATHLFCFAFAAFCVFYFYCFDFLGGDTFDSTWTTTTL